MAKLGVDRIDLLKIDVEGAELVSLPVCRGRTPKTVMHGKAQRTGVVRPRRLKKFTRSKLVSLLRALQMTSASEALDRELFVLSFKKCQHRTH